MTEPITPKAREAAEQEVQEWLCVKDDRAPGKHIQAILDAVETAAVALERIAKLRWGDVGDGGSTVLAEDGLEALSKYRRAKESHI